jgi:XTP/dITP diphosphohydrolase
LSDEEIYFATSNKHKVHEVSKILGEFGIKIKHHPFKHTEIRSESLEEIAREAVAAAYKQCRQPVFVEDTGIFIDALNGFPGTFSGWAFGKIGTRGIIDLMFNQTNRHAHFETCIAFKKDAGHISTFRGICPGHISTEERGKNGFGYDPIFVPDGEDQTFAESITLKNKLSHRYKSLLEFSKTLTSRR